MVTACKRTKVLHFRKWLSIFLEDTFKSKFFCQHSQQTCMDYGRPSQPAGGDGRRPRIMTATALFQPDGRTCRITQVLSVLSPRTFHRVGFFPRTVSSLKSCNDVFLNRGCCNEMWVHHAAVRAEESFRLFLFFALFPRRTAWFQTLCEASVLGSLLAFLLLLRLPSCRGDDEVTSDTGRWKAPPEQWGGV